MVKVKVKVKAVIKMLSKIIKKTDRITSQKISKISKKLAAGLMVIGIGLGVGMACGIEVNRVYAADAVIKTDSIGTQPISMQPINVQTVQPEKAGNMATIEWSPYLGYHQFSANQSLSDTFEAGVHLKKTIFPKWNASLRAGLLRTFDTSKSASDTVWVMPIYAGITYEAVSWRNKTLLGLGGYHADTQGASQFYLGLGLLFNSENAKATRSVQFQIGESTSLFADLYYIPISAVKELKKAKEQMLHTFTIRATPFVRGTRQTTWVFPSLEGHWAKTAAEGLAGIGLIERTKEFEPGQSVIQAEAALWLANLSLIHAVSKQPVTIQADPKLVETDYTIVIQDSLGEIVTATLNPVTKTEWAWDGSGISQQHRPAFFAKISTPWTEAKSNPIVMINSVITMDDWDILDDIPRRVVRPGDVGRFLTGVSSIEEITRLQFLTMMDGVLSKMDIGVSQDTLNRASQSINLETYTDINMLSEKDRAIVRRVVTQIGPIGTTRLEPNRTITRAEAAVLLWRLYTSL